MNENGCNCESTTCGSNCSSNNSEKKTHDFIEKTHDFNNIKRVIGIVSGKGGVGKSLVTSTLAIKMQRMGYKVGILDADITGPSIPKAFGITQKAEASQFGLHPQKTKNDIGIMSINLLIEEEEAPVIWRGPVIAGVVKQFWTDVIWGDLDYLFIDMPPGTGDVPLTVFQSIPLDGIVIVTSPQELVAMIVKKAYNMAVKMNIPVLGIIENMSYLKCPDCGKEIKLFGDSKIEATAEKLNIEVLGKMPIDPRVAELCDSGEVENISHDYLDTTAEAINRKFNVGNTGANGIVDMNNINKDINSMKNMKIAVPTEGDNISGHFGKCGSFTIFEIENSKIVKKILLDTSSNQHGLLPAFLANNGVNLVIAGGMGDGAKNNMAKNNVEVITGASGNIKAAINAYLAGNLKSTGAGCSGHDHQHGVGGCNCGD